MKYITEAGELETKRNCKVKFEFNEFSRSKKVLWVFHIDETELSDKSLGYNIIMGLDLMTKLGIIINCKKQTVWNGKKLK